jgi:hypothetical protein
LEEDLRSNPSKRKGQDQVMPSIVRVSYYGEETLFACHTEICLILVAICL